MRSSLLVFLGCQWLDWVTRLCGYLSSVQTLKLYVKRVLNRFNPMLYKDVMASVDVVNIIFLFVFKVSVKENTVQNGTGCKPACRWGYGLYLFFLYCTRELLRVFTQGFALWLNIKPSCIIELVYHMHYKFYDLHSNEFITTCTGNLWYGRRCKHCLNY